MLYTRIPGLFSAHIAKEIKERLEGKTYFNFKIECQDRGENCNLIVSSANEKGHSEEELRDMFCFACLYELAIVCGNQPNTVYILKECGNKDEYDTDDEFEQVIYADTDMAKVVEKFTEVQETLSSDKFFMHDLYKTNSYTDLSATDQAIDLSINPFDCRYYSLRIEPISLGVELTSKDERTAITED